MNNLSQKKFREMLMEELVGSFSARKKRGRPYPYHKPPPDAAVHIPVRRSEPADCVVCRKGWLLDVMPVAPEKDAGSAMSLCT